MTSVMLLTCSRKDKGALCRQLAVMCKVSFDPSESTQRCVGALILHISYLVNMTNLDSIYFFLFLANSSFRMALKSPSSPSPSQPSSHSWSSASAPPGL